MLQPRKILGLAGYAGSGKTSIAAEVGRRNNYVMLAFADEVKKIAIQSFGWDGNKDTRGRRLLQILGTEAGRDYDPDIWINRLYSQIMKHRRIIVHDVRFDNEAAFIRNLGGKVIWITRNTAKVGYHRSEHGISHKNIDYTLANNLTLEDAYNWLVTNNLL